MERFNAGDLTGAAEACLGLLANGEHAEVLHLLGVILQRLGKPADAVGMLTRALRTRPDDARLRAVLAVVWVDLGLFANALASPP